MGFALSQVSGFHLGTIRGDSAACIIFCYRYLVNVSRAS